MILVISCILSHIYEPSSPVMVNIPVFKVNFYLMGMEEVDEEITAQLGENLEYLNQEFEGRVQFELGNLMMDYNHAFIPDLHADYVKRDKTIINRLIRPIEKEGAINIYLFDTYTTNNGESAMLGFTPVLSAQHKKYESIAPDFDRLFISYAGLKDKSTIVHEMGHFFGLSHPWEMNNMSLDLMGFLEDNSARNHMTYHPEVNHFSWQQLERMHHFALTFRGYLIDHTIVSSVSFQAYVKYSSPRNSFD